MNWSSFVLEAVGTLQPLILTLLAVAIGYAVAYLRVRTEAIKNESARQIVNNILDRAHRELYDAVAATFQVFVNEAKARNADGKLTSEEIAEARRIAFEYFQAQMGEAGLRELQNIVQDVKAWFEHELEGAVYNLKAA